MVNQIEKKKKYIFNGAKPWQWKHNSNVSKFLKRQINRLMRRQTIEIDSEEDTSSNQIPFKTNKKLTKGYEY